jgi:hypothetical protein
MIKFNDDVIIDSDVVFKRQDLISIGNHVSIDKGFYCTTQLKIGDYVAVLGEISGSDNGTVKAKLIRLLPPPPAEKK